MIVLSITNCPPSLRGDLSKWLNEINTGVYIGKLSARVREEVWKRICDNIRDGQATMIYSAANAQGYSILVHNTTWEPVDFDGLTLMKRPLKAEKETVSGENEEGEKPAAAKTQRKKRTANPEKTAYVILDLETTGLECEHDFIIEMGAIRIVDNEIQDRYQCLVKQDISIPEFVQGLTGIEDSMLRTSGANEKDALEGLLKFIGNAMVVGYNIKFDMGFILAACDRQGIVSGIAKTKDVLRIARRKIQGIENYRLETVAGHFFEGAKVQHRALDDCGLVYRVYSKLNEI